MKAFVFLLLLTATGAAVAEVPAGWNTNLTIAFAQAKDHQQPVLAFFTASWCPPCRMMVHGTLTNAEVKRALKTVLPVAIDIDEQADIARQFGITAVPTFQMLLSSNDAVATTTGYQAAGPFVDWVTNSAAAARDAVVRGERCRQTLAEVDKLMAGASATDLTDAAHRLFELCDERETTIVKAAVAKLAELAKAHPSVLLDGLNHPRLAVRIQTANILHGVLGNEFSIDPWSDATIRREAIAKWREKLARPTMRPDTGR